MFVFFENLIGSIQVRLGFTRVNSPSSKNKLVNREGDNVLGDKIVHNYHDTSVVPPKNAKLIMCWGVPESHQENHKIAEYEFTFLLQNKSDVILKDVWVNFSSSGFGLELQRTKQTDAFQGWDIYGKALNLITRSDYRFAPQNFLAPFTVHILLKKESLPEEAWIYFSYGSPDVPKFEQEGKVTRAELATFLEGADKSPAAFLKLLKVGKDPR